MCFEGLFLFQIGTTDKDHGHCLLWGDPHFTGFDYKKRVKFHIIIYHYVSQKKYSNQEISIFFIDWLY